MLKVSNCFISTYLAPNNNVMTDIILRQKIILFELFDKVLETNVEDTGILKLYCRLTQSMEPENYDKILDLKLREIKSLQTTGWHYDLEQGEKITKAIQELKGIMGERFESNEEVKSYVRTTLQTIEKNTS
mmetsp:Transcript_32750/g.37421  ORF Transcript_32750/g.37421 Transcript_32750/m.37421 type:complete len:131 (-) Transcript_32750:18-410(-)